MSFFKFIGGIVSTFGLIAILLGFAHSAGAQNCNKMSNTSIERWYDPHPSSKDFHLPMPLGMSLVFVSIPLGTQGLYGDEKSTYVMGSTTPRLFETNLEVRVGSSISRGGEARFLFGKYEVSQAQYIAVMGNGSLEAGAKILIERSHDPNAKKILFGLTSGDCKGVLTREIHDYLSQPLTFLSYRDYIEFLDTYNLYCISRNNCRRKLSELGRNKDVPGFVRLPVEHEWEFVARGGQEFVAGRMSKTEFQTDLPRTEPGTTIKHYAHIGSDPPRPLPIGSRKPLFSIYDMLGNAQELMLNPFTAENGFGAVGAYVARGGHFRLSPEELRVSRRVELQAFRLDESTNSYVIQYFPLTGIRTVIGYPVIGAAQRFGDTSLVKDFVENYAPPAEAGDSAGSTIADARNLGAVGKETVKTSEELSDTDSVDYFKISLRNYSTLSVNVSSNASILFEVSNESQEVVNKGRSGSKPNKSSALLPGDYWIKLTPVRRLENEERYHVEISRHLVADTGIKRLDPAELAQASPLKKTLQFFGYVGSGDTVDTFPVRDQSRVGGIELKVKNFEAPVELTYIDDKLNIVRRIDSSNSSDILVMNLNSEFGKGGFIQVSAAANSATTYNLTIAAKESYNKIFKKTPDHPVSSYGTENVHYEGNLNQSLPALYLPIRIKEPRILKVELTDLFADIDLRVLDSDKVALQSSNIRKGTSPEFFFKPVEAGEYFAEVRLKSSNDVSQFKLLHTTEKLPDNIYAADRIIATRSNATDFGYLEDTGILQIVTLDQETNYYRFNTRGAYQKIQIEVSGSFSSNSYSPDVYLEDQQGTPLVQSINNYGWTKLEAIVSSGINYLRLKRRDNSPIVSLYLVLITADSSTIDPDLSQYGNQIETHRDFQIYRQGDKCTMITVAKRSVPERGWRDYKPHFGISVERNSDTIGIWIDDLWPNTRFDLYRIGSIKARVYGYGNFSTDWSANSNLLQPIDSEGYVSNKALEGFIKGSKLEITGTTPDNRSTRIEYSLLGYVRAARRINQICRGDADWIWEL